MSEDRVGGRKRAFCISVPKRMITGATIFSPMGTTRGQPAAAISLWNRKRSVGVQPGPPYSAGQSGAAQPRTYSFFCQRRWPSLSR
ncbi:hypothetical protein D3C76_294180 [compost metagenome]